MKNTTDASATHVAYHGGDQRDALIKDSADTATERLVRAARDSTAELLTSLGLGHEPLTSDGCRQLDRAYLDEFRAVDGFDQPYWLGSQVSVGEERVHAG